MAQRVKRLPAMWETWVRALGREDPLEKEMQPTPVFLPGKPHGRRNLVGYSPRGPKALDMTERLHFHFFTFRSVITFLPRNKRLLISWLQSPSAVILEPRKIKSDTVATASPSICHEMMGPDAMILVF